MIDWQTWEQYRQLFEFFLSHSTQWVLLIVQNSKWCKIVEFVSYRTISPIKWKTKVNIQILPLLCDKKRFFWYSSDHERLTSCCQLKQLELRDFKCNFIKRHAKIKVPFFYIETWISLLNPLAWKIKNIVSIVCIVSLYIPNEMYLPR